MLKLVEKGLKENLEERWRTAEEMSCEITEVVLYDKQIRRPRWLLGPAILDINYNGYKQENIVCSFLGEHTEVPPENREVYQKARVEAEKKLREDVIWNGSMLALKGAKTFRRIKDDEEEQCLSLTFAANDYLHHCAMHEVWKSLNPEKKAPMLAVQFQLDENGLFPYHKYCTSFGIHMTILTSDNKLMFLERSTTVNTEKKSITMGFTGTSFFFFLFSSFIVGCMEKKKSNCQIEGMNNKDITREGIPNLWMCAARGVFEEIGIEIPEKEWNRMKFLGIGFAPFLLFWGFVGYIDLRNGDLSFTSEEIHENIKGILKKPKDLFETQEVFFVDLHPDTMFDFLKSKEATIADGVFAAVLNILYTFYSRKEVNLSLNRKLNLLLK
jgi:hypothetical protein